MIFLGKTFTLHFPLPLHPIDLYPQRPVTNFLFESGVHKEKDGKADCELLQIFSSNQAFIYLLEEWMKAKLDNKMKCNKNDNVRNIHEERARKNSKTLIFTLIFALIIITLHIKMASLPIKLILICD